MILILWTGTPGGRGVIMRIDVNKRGQGSPCPVWPGSPAIGQQEIPGPAWVVQSCVTVIATGTQDTALCID